MIFSRTCAQKLLPSGGGIMGTENTVNGLEEASNTMPMQVR